MASRAVGERQAEAAQAKAVVEGPGAVWAPEAATARAVAVAEGEEAEGQEAAAEGEAVAWEAVAAEAGRSDIGREP